MEYKNNTILLVDDEPSVVKSLKRLIRPLGCEVLISTSPVEALETLKETNVDVVISDMRMPEMPGEEFLAEVAKLYPETERIVLSGYADAQATIEVVNKGKIGRFMLKPWEEDDVTSMVKDAFRLANLKLENEALQKQTAEKNKQLAALNSALDAKVKARTAQLEKANSGLKGHYRALIRMLSLMAARRLGDKATEENETRNAMLRGVAELCGVKQGERQQLYYAWQLRNIGKLGFGDDLIHSPYIEMETAQAKEYQKHPVLAQATLHMVKPLYPAGQIIMQHKEYCDGSGYPKGLKQEEIDVRAQILCVVNDYVELISGNYDQREYSTSEAITHLRETEAGRYNQDVVVNLCKVLKALASKNMALKDVDFTSDKLEEGMKLSRDLISGQGILLLSAGQVLDSTSIGRIREMEMNLRERLDIYVSS